ncbi:MULTISPECIES: hypothetical protein [Micrococcus]|uniref:hypothetical protein n=1 Tax=Micrococcus TaxID=1269 RepID=UPI00077E0266|nr:MULTISPECIES: hypothetical protein [unclassified Micrococcus]KYK00973.1 hypothetical protein AUV02_08460 [Micrococcus sp. CH3]KYK06350.1 hypothetical protein AUV08_06505 [Micrococcus sp. CH7]MCV7577748.1 hypothetical protein [Micrococcus luteus]MCV7632561.1 hypothetical protein [Micrococcus luteus]
MTGAGGRRRRRRWENRRGWWGILGWSLAAAGAALAITCAAWLLSAGGEAAGSALLGGGAVLALSALTGVTTALVWDRAREAALPVSVGLFVLKIAVFAVLLGVLPRPHWVRPDAAAISALVTILVWQAAEVLVFARTRRGIYAD